MHFRENGLAITFTWPNDYYFNFNEKVRIFHHGLHSRFQKRSTTTKLTTPNGSVEGHCACAKGLEENVKNHLLNPAPLGPFSQNILLAEVLPSFTEGDNEMLLSLPNKDKVHKILKSCRPHSAPGTDSITACFYQQNWDLIGDHLTEVIQKVFLGTNLLQAKKHRSWYTGISQVRRLKASLSQIGENCLC